MKYKILLLSGYDAASHQYWRQQLTQNLIDFDWVELALPPRHFSWRSRGSSLSFAFQSTEILSQPFDRMIATSMVDLASLRGFIPSLAKVPTLLYFHENQFVYPISKEQPNIVNTQLTAIYSALCADKLIFNSHYNQATFFQGAKKLLQRLPDGVPGGILDLPQKRSSVLPVPISIDRQGCQSSIQLVGNKPVHIVWNHRWEYDKQPQVFFDAISQLKANGYCFRLHVLGQSFRQVPEVFTAAKELFCDEIESWGFQSRDQYEAILSKSDLVVSSALHDFQGLSLLEGIAKGCFPLAPNRVAYPEYLPSQCLYETDQSSVIEANNLYEKIKLTIENKNIEIPDISQYYPERIFPQYFSLIKETVVC